MFSFGPLWSLMIGPRLSIARLPRLRNSVILTNVALAVVIGLQCWFLGWGEFLLVQMPCAMIAATAGVWLFFVQHQSRTSTGRTRRVELRRRRCAAAPI